MPKNQGPIWILSLLAFLPAGAQELVTDRPDQTESSAVVPAGSVQIEAGALLEREGTTDLAAPGTLVRYGLSPRFEARLAWPGRVRGGLADPELGVKAILGSLALIAHVSLPVGDEDAGTPRADPSLRVAAAHDLTERVGLGWNLGWEAASTGKHTRARWVYTAAVGFELGGPWGAFVEAFGDLPASDPGPAAHALDAGLTYLLGPTLQLDLAVGLGLNSAAPDRFVGAGVSVRFPR